VTEPPRDGAEVDAGREKLSGRVVPQRVDVRVDVETLREVVVPTRHRRGRTGLRRIECSSARDVHLLGQLTGERSQPFHTALLLLGEQGDGFESSPAQGVIMSLGSTASYQEIARRDALAERLFTGLLETMELLTVQLGVELGLYACLHREGPATAGQFFGRSGGHPPALRLGVARTDNDF
jgi:hypothetical protein